jgi:signal peptidase I
MRIKNIKSKHITYAVLGVLVGFVILLAISPVIGLRFDTILSGSMSPSMNIGDLVVVTPTSPEDLKVGDVIVFHSPNGGGLVCHRIVAIDQGDGSLAFQTKGDANEDPDPLPLDSDSIVGKVQVCIPMMGYVVKWLQGPFGLLMILALGAAALLIPEKPKESKKEVTKEDVNGDA